ncbi:MAG: sulfatase [Planctomycetota bacterium]|nr:sulfatase [Planctomycetota bacterium]
MRSIALFLVLLMLPACGDEGPQGNVKTIVLITLDTLRRDHVSAYAPDDLALPQPVTQALDDLAATGIRFDDARAPVPLTLPSHTTMLTGLPPAATGVRLNTYGRLAPPNERGFPMLQETLREAGWRTAAFVSADALNARYGLDQGFEVYDFEPSKDARRRETNLPERRGRETVGRALAHVKGIPASEKLFLFVHLFEPHAPYDTDGTYGGDVEDGSRIVGELLEGLAKLGRRDGAAILFTSDHGEALGELRERTHGFTLADGVLRVPFTLTAPGIEPDVRTDPAELADVAPTLAGLAGIPWQAVAGPGCGIDLLAGQAPTDRPRIAESLYGHHIHRWAQLTAASSEQGTLVDAGQDRLHWVPRAGHQLGIQSTGTVKDTPEIRRLAKVLAEYRQFEQPDLMQGGQVAAGYGGGGVVEGFLTPADNARLPDPHAAILTHYRLDGIKAQIVSQRIPRALRAARDAADALDQAHLLRESPELHFWRGEARVRLAKYDPEADVPKLFREAEKAFLRAFQLGRKDTQTLVRACGVNAGGREQECLDRLLELGRQVPQPGPQFAKLEARLRKALGR